MRTTLEYSAYFLAVILSIMRSVGPHALGLTFIVLTCSATLAFAADLKMVPWGGTQVSSTVAEKLKGGCDSDPYAWLEQRHKGDRSNSFVTPRPQPDGSLKNGLDPVLACRLKKLLEVAESKGCRLSINSAMRPVQRCNRGGGACARQGNSCHQYGLAADLGGTPQCLAWLTSVIGRKNANSPFGLHVAYVENGNYRHVQCVEHLVANASSGGGCRTPCNGGLPISTDVSNVPPPSDFPKGPPLGLGDIARQYSGLGQQGPPPPAIPPQPATMQPQQYFQPTQTGQPAPAGQPAPTGQPSGGTPVAEGQPSVGDKLLELAAGTGGTGSSITIATTVPLIVGKDTTKVTGKSTTTLETIAYGSTTPFLRTPETFGPNDGSYDDDSPVTTTHWMVQFLAQLKNLLLRMLEILRPFGTRATIDSETYEIHE